MLLSLLAVLTTASASTLNAADISFEEYLRAHKKNYAADEVETRRDLFELTKKSIVSQNKLYHSGKSTWFAAINHLTDATDQELAQYGAKRARTPAQASPLTTTATTTATATATATTSNPATKSWINYQTPVKNQGGCGSCWSFSTVEALESHLAISENSTQPLVLSPQTLVDCGTNPKQCGGTGGCGGSTAELGFNYTKAKGMGLGSGYPYTGKDGTCQHYTSAVTNSGYTKLTTNSAEALETAIATVGPVAVVVAANWQTYGGGIMADGCLNWLGSCDLDHVVVVVGYAADYWLVRNSWGASWGEEGYIRLTRKNDNVTYTDTKTSMGTGCVPFPAKQLVMGEGGVLFDASYPTGVVRSKE